MDCSAARHLLDVVSTAADSSVVVGEALAHVRSCPECAELIASRRAFDNALAAVMQEVAIPPGLRERLLSAVSGSLPARSSDSAIANPGRRSRRQLIRAAGAAALVIGLGCGLWQFARRPPRAFDLEAVQASVAALIRQSGGQLDVEGLPQFDHSFDLAAYGEWAASVDLRGLNIDNRGGQDAAVALIPIGRGSQAMAILLIIPAGRLTDSNRLASQFKVSYAPVANAVRREGDLVLVCITTAGHLDDLKRFAASSAA